MSRVRCVCVLLAMVTLLVSTATAVSVVDATGDVPGFSPLQPTRAMDTRKDQGGVTFGAESVQHLDLSWLPPDARSVSLNITAVGATSDTFITVWPTGRSRPDTSNLNVRHDQTRANAVMVGLGDNQKVSIYNFSGQVDILVDVMGWYGTGFTGIQPTRIVDTRKGIGATAPESLTTFDVALDEAPGIPEDAQAVVINLTAVGPAAEGFLTVWPTGSLRPGTSNLNFRAGDTVANLVVVGLGDNQSVTVYNYGGTVDVLMDITGWFDSSSQFVPMPSPLRTLDTRAGTCGFELGPGEVRNLLIPSDGTVGGVVMNVTALDATAETFVTVWPAGTPRPDASNLNLVPGQGAVPNLVTSALGQAGEISIFNHAGTLEVLVDVFGSFLGDLPDGEPTPCPEKKLTPPPPETAGMTGFTGVTYWGSDVYITKQATTVPDFVTDYVVPFAEQCGSDLTFEICRTMIATFNGNHPGYQLRFIMDPQDYESYYMFITPAGDACYDRDSSFWNYPREVTCPGWVMVTW